MAKQTCSVCLIPEWHTNSAQEIWPQCPCCSIPSKCTFPDLQNSLSQTDVGPDVVFKNAPNKHRPVPSRPVRPVPSRPSRPVLSRPVPSCPVPSRPSRPARPVPSVPSVPSRPSRPSSPVLSRPVPSRSVPTRPAVMHSRLAM